MRHLDHCERIYSRSFHGQEGGSDSNARSLQENVHPDVYPFPRIWRDVSVRRYEIYQPAGEGIKKLNMRHETLQFTLCHGRTRSVGE